MQYVAFAFGIFGLVAFLELSSLRKKIDDVQRELTKIKGTSFHEERSALVKAAKSYAGKQVEIDFKEDHGDVDIMMHGNDKHGSNLILDADEEWLLVHTSWPKGSMNKLIRMESVARISCTNGSGPEQKE